MDDTCPEHASRKQCRKSKTCEWSRQYGCVDKVVYNDIGYIKLGDDAVDYLSKHKKLGFFNRTVWLKIALALKGLVQMRFLKFVLSLLSGMTKVARWHTTYYIDTFWLRASAFTNPFFAVGLWSTADHIDSMPFMTTMQAELLEAFTDAGKVMGVFMAADLICGVAFNHWSQRKQETNALSTMVKIITTAFALCRIHEKLVPTSKLQMLFVVLIIAYRLNKMGTPLKVVAKNMVKGLKIIASTLLGAKEFMDKAYGKLLGRKDKRAADKFANTVDKAYVTAIAAELKKNGKGGEKKAKKLAAASSLDTLGKLGKLGQLAKRLMSKVDSAKADAQAAVQARMIAAAQKIKGL